MKIKILFIIVAVLFVSVLDLLYLNLQKPANVTVPKTGNITLPTSVITIADSTAGWKTYENKQNGFSFKYPSKWLSEGFPGSEDVAWTIPGQFGPYVLTLSFKGTQNKTVEEFIKRDQFPYDLIKKSNDWTIVSDPVTEGSSVIVAFSKNNQKIYSLTLQSDPPKLDVDAIKLLDQILSTFKFTENKVESFGNWVKRSNGDFITNDSCVWLQISKANYNGDLKQYLQNFYRLPTVSNMLYSKQFSIKNSEAITIEATGMEEMFTVYFSKGNLKYGITFLNGNQDPNKDCTDYQKDADYVLNNVDLFL